MQIAIIPILLFGLVAIGLAVAIIGAGYLFNPRRPSRVKEMPYESGMDPAHDIHRRFDIRFHLLAIAFLVFDVELLFLYPWAVASHQPTTPTPTQITAAQKVEQEKPDLFRARNSLAPVADDSSFDAAVESGQIESRGILFGGVMLFIIMVTLGFVYDWRKGIFHWR